MFLDLVLIKILQHKLFNFYANFHRLINGSLLALNFS